MKLTDTCDYPDLPGDSDGKAPVYNAGALGSIPGSGETPEKGKVTPPPGLWPGETHALYSPHGEVRYAHFP